ncbi:hypothetical protein PV439_44080, partial [Streptomyces scabiei]|nr:hypothetical protein [Streptomyces scabiei]
MWTGDAAATTVRLGGVSSTAAWPGEAALSGVRPVAEPPGTAGRAPDVASTAAVRPAGDGTGPLPVAVGPGEASPGAAPGIVVPRAAHCPRHGLPRRPEAPAPRVRRWTAGGAAATLVSGAGREALGGTG